MKDQYFYIVSQLNGYVLDVSSGEEGGRLIMYPAHGGSNQLWKWDESCRLISKQGLALDIESVKAPTSGTHCVANEVHEGLSQKWRLEESAIRSNLNNLVIDVAWARKDISAFVHMWDVNGTPAQKWLFVPEKAWDDYKVLKAKPNALNMAQFWKNLVDNYFDVVIGCSINDYQNGAKKAVKAIDECASRLEQIATDPKTAFLDGVAAGQSLSFLTVDVNGVKGEATTFWNDIEMKVAPFFRATLSLQGFLSEYVRQLREAAEFLETADGETVARDAHNILYRGKEAGLIDWNTYKVANGVVTGVQHVKQAMDIKLLVDFIQADYYSFNGVRLGLATHLDSYAVTSGNATPLLEKSLVSAEITSARALFGTVAVIGAALGVWNNHAGGADRIKHGKELAHELRESSKQFKRECEKLIELHKALQ